jgi:hypothetical protein
MTDPGVPGYTGPPEHRSLYGSGSEYGEPTYPTAEYGQQLFTPYTGAAPANGGSGARQGLWAMAIIAVLAAVGVIGYFLFSGSGASGTRTAFPGAPAGSVSVPAQVPVPSVSNGLPPIVIPSISVPSIGNYCANSISALNTAATYLGTIEIGALDLAQGCVYRGSVPPSVTTRIAAGKRFYAPTSASQRGPVFDFVSTDHASTVQITVTKESDGKYYVTRVVLR